MFNFKLRKRHDKQKIAETLLERMNRGEDGDRVYIGGIVEEALNGDFGSVLNLIINGIIDSELMKPETNSERKLGRIEGLNILQDMLEQCIADKQALVEDIKEDSSIGVDVKDKEEVVQGVPVS